MRKFKGFKPGPVAQIKMPESFFTELVPLIDDLGELQITLYAFWALYQKEGEFRYLRWKDFAESEMLLQSLSLADPHASPLVTLNVALKKSVKRGSLLTAEIKLPNSVELLYFLNTVTGRRAIASIQQGAWHPGDTDNPVEILPPRPTIYQLYEDIIGTIKGTMVDALKDAEREFPYLWIEEAFQIAVEHNARKWSYVYAILERWDREGRDRGLTGGHSQADGKEYISGKYAAYIKYKPDE
jgi:DnaD/phage-associated family protein